MTLSELVLAENDRSGRCHFPTMYCTAKTMPIFMRPCDDVAHTLPNST